MRYFRMLIAIVLMFSVNVCAAQTDSNFGNTMRSNGRIYVVIAVLATILIGLIIYMIRVERKIGKLEKETI
jgi:hypothetical protein